MQNQSSKIVYAGRLIDGVTDRVQTNMSVIIEGGSSQWMEIHSPTSNY